MSKESLDMGRCMKSQCEKLLSEEKTKHEQEIQKIQTKLDDACKDICSLVNGHKAKDKEIQNLKDMNGICRICGHGLSEGLMILDAKDKEIAELRELNQKYYCRARKTYEPKLKQALHSQAEEIFSEIERCLHNDNIKKEYYIQNKSYERIRQKFLSKKENSKR